MHPIYDIDSGVRINPSADIVVGRHVWIAQGALILKGSVIPDDSIVAARSLVTSSLRSDESNCLIAGAPARVIGTRVTWEKNLNQPFRGSWKSKTNFG